MMYSIFSPIARRLWPELDTISEQRRLVGVGDVAVTFLNLPLALFGLIWLLRVTDWRLLGAEWPRLALFGGLIYLFKRLNYFFIIEIRADRYGSADGSLASMAQWAAAFLLGPTAVWLSILGQWFGYLSSWLKPASPAARWNQLRGLVMEQAGTTLGFLVALKLYAVWGGTIPIAGLDLQNVVLALAALGVHFGVVLAVWSLYTAYAIWIQRVLTQPATIAPILKFIALALGMPVLAHPFAILLAGLYVEHGLAIFVYLSLGLFLVAYLTRRLSWAGEASRQQSRQLEQLESLGRAIIDAPLDGSALAQLLGDHIPMMFPSGRVAIWMAGQGFLYRNPSDWYVGIEPVWDWACEKGSASAFLEREPLPWVSVHQRHDPVVITLIVDADEATPMGCIYIELRSLAQPWDRKALHSLFPAMKSLAAHVASTIRQAQIYAETLANQSAVQELAFAGRIQASFLPNEVPIMHGWELAVTLLPSRETSGDFFDFILLPDGKVGIVIADVADKGVGAALYMALSRTLIRTYALEYNSRPDIVFFSANERILQDARANLFVTTFYAVLDPETGTLSYANAGHNPPILLSQRDGATFHALAATGMPLGIDDDATWTLEQVSIEPGEALVLYTDGIPDAQDSDGNFFRERRLMETAQQHLGESAQEIQRGILDAVQAFAGDAAQFDDITLLVIKRDPLPDGESAAEVLASEPVP